MEGNVERFLLIKCEDQNLMIIGVEDLASVIKTKFERNERIEYFKDGFEDIYDATVISESNDLEHLKKLKEKMETRRAQQQSSSQAILSQPIKSEGNVEAMDKRMYDEDLPKKNSHADMQQSAKPQENGNTIEKPKRTQKNCNKLPPPKRTRSQKQANSEDKNQSSKQDSTKAKQTCNEIDTHHHQIEVPEPRPASHDQLAVSGPSQAPRSKEKAPKRFTRLIPDTSSSSDEEFARGTPPQGAGNMHSDHGAQDLEDSLADTLPEDDTGNRNMHPDHGIENLDHVYGEHSDKGEMVPLREGSNIFIIKYVKVRAENRAKSGTSLIRKYAPGIFTEEAIKKCTISGDPSGIVGKQNFWTMKEQMDILCPEVVDELIDHVLNFAREKKLRGYKKLLKSNLTHSLSDALSCSKG